MKNLMKSPKKTLTKSKQMDLYNNLNWLSFRNFEEQKKNVYDIWSYQTCNGLSIYISNNISVSVIHHHSSSGLEWQVPVVLWLLLFFFLENYLLHKNVGCRLELPTISHRSGSDTHCRSGQVKKCCYISLSFLAFPFLMILSSSFINLLAINRVTNWLTRY